MVMAWHVVVFVGEDRVEVVPKCWLINNQLCYWPNIRKKNISSLIKSCSLPEIEKWDIVKIRLMCPNKVYENYEQASNAATKACYKSDISSSEPDNVASNKLTLNSSKGRVIKKNKRFLPSSDDEADTSYESNASSLQSLPSQATSKISNKIPILKEVADDYSGDECVGANQKNPYAVTPSLSKSILIPKKSADVLSSTPVNTLSNEETLQKLCSRISYLTLLIKGVVDDIASIKNHLEAASQPTPSELPGTEEAYQFPFNNIENLEEFDKTLKERDNYLKIVKFMSRIGGESPYDFVKRVMGRILTDELASQFSFTGHKGKKAFGVYFVTKALQDASKNIRKLKDCTEVDIEKRIKDWLRHAPARAKKERGDEARIVEDE